MSDIASRQNQVVKDLINPYITDGLIAMWDAEWNAGIGVHDPTAIIWKDLSGNKCHLSPVNGFDGIEFGEKSASTTANTSLVAKTPDVTTPDYTFELISDDDWGILDVQAGLVTMYDNTKMWKFDDQFFGVRYGTHRYQYASKRGQILIGDPGMHKMRFQHVFMYDNGCLFYNEGKMFRRISECPQSSSMHLTANEITLFKKGTSADWAGYAWKSIHSIRLYGKALSEEELAHNYTIDKERFEI